MQPHQSQTLFILSNPSARLLPSQPDNGSDAEFEALLATCESNLSAFANKTTYIRSPTAHESRHLVHEMVDFIYLDTRHDYCEVRERGEG